MSEWEREREKECENLQGGEEKNQITKNCKHLEKIRRKQNKKEKKNEKETLQRSLLHAQ